MIVIKDEPRYIVYCRKNRRVQWRYATYAGCYDSVAEAIKAIKEHLPGQNVQYLVEDAETGKETIGEISGGMQ